jgi:hypothetical protein
VATTWIFQHADRTMYVQRPDRVSRVQLVIWGTDMADQVYSFNDEIAFVDFLSDFEARSMADGWSLIDFIPERRSGTDRRASPRAGDRRRPPSTATGTVISFPVKPSG